MPTKSPPWRNDFSRITPEQRRLGRYALQLVCGAPDLLPRENRGRSNLLDHLWPLVLPLLEPERLVAWLAWDEPAMGRLPAGALADRIEELEGREIVDFHRRLCRLVSHGHRRALERLAAVDGDAPLNPTVALLADTLDLGPTELRLLDYVDLHEASEPLRLLLRTSDRRGARDNRVYLAAALGVGTEALRNALAREAPLRALGLLNVEPVSDLEDFVRAGDLLGTILDAAPADANSLMALLVEPAPGPAWRLADFPHLQRHASQVAAVLGAAVRRREPGVNALFYGAPGTGKTELARAISHEQGLTAYQVRTSDEEGDGLRRSGRLCAYLLAQRLLARINGAVLIFDEIEDVFDNGDGLLALLRGQTAGRDKGWMNRILEDNPVPTIWITNSTDAMDPAFLRRFLLPLAFTTPPRSVRRRIAERHLGNSDLPETLLDDLAADDRLSPAQLAAAGRLLTLCPDAPAADTVRLGTAAMRTLLHGAPAPRRRQRATSFDAAFLNLAGDTTPNAIVRALHRRGEGSLCFYGPPGTGKTAFAEVLAEALDRELIARRTSDLMSPYVGETEQNLARLFHEADPDHSLLLLDEVDSFLAERRSARHQWERTMVNELLQQMESYPGIFVAATNLMTGIDAAALRRFDFKLHFRPLTPAQRRALFAREALGDPAATPTPEVTRKLDSLDALTPGDFANACRQRALLGEPSTPEQFLRRLIAEHRMKRSVDVEAI
jgi:transitional endoplasmic reticulum ATPase